jgi:pSer/pThr/pTyr-binding forkhead associated (FHA) protein
MDLNLIVLTGTQQGQVLDVGPSALSVGRHPLCTFRPVCPLVSRHHCMIVRRDGKVFVRDLYSRNGTFVNDQRVTDEVELCHGDRIMIGSVLLAVCLRSGCPVDENTQLPAAKTANAESAPAIRSPTAPVPGT